MNNMVFLRVTIKYGKVKSYNDLEMHAQFLKIQWNNKIRNVFIQMYHLTAITK